MTKSTICDRCRYLAHEYYEDIQPASSCCNNSARNSGCGCAAQANACADATAVKSNVCANARAAQANADCASARAAQANACARTRAAQANAARDNARAAQATADCANARAAQANADCANARAAQANACRRPAPCSCGSRPAAAGCASTRMAQANACSRPAPCSCGSRQSDQSRRCAMNDVRNTSCACAQSSCDVNVIDQQSLMMQITQCEFICIDINLYLDTHPCDERALADYNCYAQQLEALKALYVKHYGPLQNFGNSVGGENWNWIDQPWPWCAGKLLEGR